MTGCQRTVLWFLNELWLNGTRVVNTFFFFHLFASCFFKVILRWVKKNRKQSVRKVNQADVSLFNNDACKLCLASEFVLKSDSRVILSTDSISARNDFLVALADDHRKLNLKQFYWKCKEVLSLFNGWHSSSAAFYTTLW